MFATLTGRLFAYSLSLGHYLTVTLGLYSQNVTWSQIRKRITIIEISFVTGMLFPELHRSRHTLTKLI